MKFMNKISYSLLAAGVLMLSSCKNELPEFTDSDAFVAFESSSVSYSETKGEVTIPVSLVSLNGLNATVAFNFEDSTATAQEGVHFTIASESKTLTFTPESSTQYITLNIIDNDEYTGDVKFSINLVEPSGVNLGYDRTLSFTIEDDEHPLAFMLGTYDAKGTSYFNGAQEWTVTLSKDDTDPSKVWITGLVPGGSSASTPLYGTVSDDHTTLSIPTGQEVASTSYPHVLFEAFLGPDVASAEDMPEGDPVVATIEETASGTVIYLTNYCFGSHVYTDDAATASAGWYNIMNGDCVLKLK